MTEVMTEPVERKCSFEEVFDLSFIELIRLVPQNPYVRALILKLTGKMPGPECATFEQIKVWVEANCEKKVRSLPSHNASHNLVGGITITVQFSETEYGRADYSVPRSGSEEFRIGPEDLVELVQEAIEAGGGIDEVVESVASKIDDEAWDQCDPGMDDYGDYNYCEHDSSESSNSETSYSKNDIRNAVLRFVRERHPELAAEL